MTIFVEGCVFCSIIAGDLPSDRVVDDELAVAILDVRPLFSGHLLLFPRDHHQTLADLPAELVGPLFRRAQRLSTLMESVLDAKGSFVAINNRVSQSVPHLHIHIVPRTPKDGLRGFFWPRTTYGDADPAAEVATRLAAAYAADPVDD